MKLIAKYAKPYFFVLLICIALLFGQAMADLSLPNLMSDIVDVGIQQSGIEESAPEAISQEGFNLIKLFADDNDKKLLEDNYKLEKPDSNTTEKFPKSENKEIYILNSAQHDKQLDYVFGRSAMTMLQYAREVAKQQGKAQKKTDNYNMKLENVYISELYPLLEMPAEMLGDLSQYQKDSSSIDDTILSSTGIMMAKSFYEELGANTGRMQTKYVVIAGGKMLLLTIVGALLTVLVGFFASRTSAGIARTLRHDVFAKVESFSSAEFDKFSTASLITRTTNDITQVQIVMVLIIRIVFYAPIIGIGGVLMAVNKSTSMGWIIATAVIVLLGLLITIFLIVRPKFKTVQKQTDKLNLVTRESLTGLMVVRAFGNQKFEEQRFEKANRDLTKTNLFVNRVMVVMMPVMNLVMNGLALLIMWFGAKQINSANIQVGDMMAYMQYSVQIIMSFLMIGMMFIMVPRAFVSIGRVQEVLDTDLVIKDPAKPISMGDKPKGEIEFKDVSFRYGGAEEDVLCDINFTAKPGKTTAFIGSTGSGKSTLINLIPRFYDVSEGQVLVDGVDVRELEQHELRHNIGYVPQKGTLFSGDIASNLSYGNQEATDDELYKAAEIAQATEFISQDSAGLHREISQGGVNVSGGQKQRLSIGRAVAKNPKIFIFDDSFSALDFKTDAQLRRALNQHTQDATVLIVAQRVGTIMGADNIVVLDQGRIVGQGTHEELLESSDVYYEIAASQLSSDELHGKDKKGGEEQ